MTLFSLNNPLLHHPPQYPVSGILGSLLVIVLQLRRMAAQEVREYRNLSKKLVEIEERGRMLKTLMLKNIGLNEEEHFVQKELLKMKTEGVKCNSKLKINQRKEMITLSMRFKVKDNYQHMEKIRKKRNWYKGKVEKILGKKSGEYRRLAEEIKKTNLELREKLKRKYVKKVTTLERKYGKLTKPQTGREELDNEMF